MYLSVHQIVNSETVATTMRVEETMTFRFVRLRLFKWDTPDGILTVTFKDGSTTIGSTTLALSSLSTEVGTYFHGYVRLDMGDSGMRVNLKGTEAYKELNVEISLSGHTDDPVNYIALAKNFEGAFVDSHGTISNEDDMTTEQLTHFQPFGIEVFKNA